MRELKPCPHCGGKSYVHTEDVFFVECWKCRFSGPDSGTEEDAVESWNAIPLRLRWTKEPPTEQGYYWFRKEGFVEVVKVYRDKVQMFVQYHGNDEDWDLPEGEWAGPIEEPVK